MEADGAITPATTGDDMAEALAQAMLDGDTRSLSRGLLRSAGPRLLRDTLGPTLSFYGGWKASGSLIVGIALATTSTPWRPTATSAAADGRA